MKISMKLPEKVVGSLSLGDACLFRGEVLVRAAFGYRRRVDEFSETLGNLNDLVDPTRFVPLFSLHSNSVVFLPIDTAVEPVEAEARIYKIAMGD